MIETTHADDTMERAVPSTIPLRRKIVYSLATVCIGLMFVETVCRLLVASVPNERWQYHATLINSVGFGELNEILEPDAALFWRVKPGIDAAYIYAEVLGSQPMSFTVTTDRLGCRRMPTAPRATKRVLFLGDSCTFGVGVDDDETFAYLLQQRLGDVQCLNYGVPGYSSFQGRRRLEMLEGDLPPDIVVVSFLFNDDSAWDGRSDLEHVNDQRSFASFLTRNSRFALLVAGLKPAPHPVRPRAKTRPRLTDREYSRELKMIVQLCRAQGSQPVFLLWPLRSQMYDDSVYPKQEIVKYLGKSDDIPVIDLLSEFRENGGASLFADVVHANKDGNKLIADELEPVIRRLLQPGRKSTLVSKFAE